jgi:molybdopterin synthase sulfur carrier subunit
LAEPGRAAKPGVPGDAPGPGVHGDHDDHGETGTARPAIVHLPRSLVALFPGCPRRMEAEGETLVDVIRDADRRVPGLANRVLDAGPSLRRHLNVYVAGERAALGTPVPPGADVHVIPAVSGG